MFSKQDHRDFRSGTMEGICEMRCLITLGESWFVRLVSTRLWRCVWYRVCSHRWNAINIEYFITLQICIATNIFERLYSKHFPIDWLKYVLKKSSFALIMYVSLLAKVILYVFLLFSLVFGNLIKFFRLYKIIPCKITLLFVCPSVKTIKQRYLVPS